MVKRYLFAAALICGSLCANAEKQYMIVEQKTGSKFGFLLDDNPEITYKDGNLVVNGNEQTSYAIGSVKNYHFSETSVADSKIEEANALRIVNLDEATLQVMNAMSAAKVTLIAANGIVVYTATTDADGSAVLSLPSQKGAYILSVGEKSIKIIRK